MRVDRRRAVFILKALGRLVVLTAMSHAAIAESRAPIPTPKFIIYPGDVIQEDMLVDVSPEEAPPSTLPILQSRASILGKVAKRTLLPGQAIPAGGVAAPRLIANGAEVKIVYVEDGLSIVATGMALQEGWLGDIVRIRNSDSGVIVTGKVQTDGTVRVDGE